MRSEEIEFYSEGTLVRGDWHRPDDVDGPVPALVQGPGWMGLRDAVVYRRYHQAFTDAGIGVLAIDFRGFGGSDGLRDQFRPADQLADLVNAVTYLETRDDVGTEAIGGFGNGGTGGGTVIVHAAVDRRLRVAVSQVPVADGGDWLHRMRHEHEWLDLLAQLDEDRRTRVLTGVGRTVNPRSEIMIPTPERVRSGFKADVDGRIPRQVPLAAVEAIIAYRPIDQARGLTTPLMVVGVEGDATTPTDHAVDLYEAAAGPKELVLLRHTSHYASYNQYSDQVIPRMVAFVRTHLTEPGDLVVRSEP